MENSLKSILSDFDIFEYGVADVSELRVNRAMLAVKCPGFEPKSAILFLIPYFVRRGVNISAYATSRDYHLYVKQLTAPLTARLNEQFSGSFAMFCDNSPIDERHAAQLAGLGSIGENGLLLNRRYGSYVFISEILSDLDSAVFNTEKHSSNTELCTHCGACRRNCPTGCLTDFTKPCLSAVTQKKGVLTEEEKALIIKNQTAWGCDACQLCCPVNRNAEQTPIEFFYQSRTEELNTQMTESMSEEEFSQRAYAWRTRNTVLRNLAILGI